MAAAAVALLIAAAAVRGGTAGAADLSMAAGWFGRSLEVRLDLDAPAPFRVFTLDAPPRLVVDLEGDGLAGLRTEAEAAGRPAAVTGLRFGRLPGGWSRLVLALGAPLAVETAELSGRALQVRLVRVGRDTFAARAGAPPGVWTGQPEAPEADGRLVVAVDAGHGGADPGAVAGGVEEKAVVLDFARVLAARLERDGVRVEMIRDGDVFRPLGARVEQARAGGADLLLSLHSNAVADPRVRGAIAFTRSERGSNPEAAARALIENAADRNGGLAAAGLDPEVFSALAAHSRRAADRRSEAAAAAIVAALEQAGAATGRYPRQSAAFAVLGAPDLPSVLLELGFLSNPEDRANLTSPGWRLKAADALRRGIRAWAEAETGAGARLPAR